MDLKTADILRKLNNDFYREQAASFAATRQAPWPGWQRCLERGRSVFPISTSYADEPHRTETGKTPRPLSVFDLGCGNLRFEVFLASKFPDIDFNFFAVDSCDDLLPKTPVVRYQHLDILEVLHQGQDLGPQLTAPACDLSVTFGIMHHVPLPEHRAEIMTTLVNKTRPGGRIIVSLWQFLRDPVRAKKAQVTHEHALKELGLASLDPGDFLLGWKDLPGVYRYCHSFSDAEVDALAASVADRAIVVDRFRADGRTGDLNAYLVLQSL